MTIIYPNGKAVFKNLNTKDGYKALMKFIKILHAKHIPFATADYEPSPHFFMDENGDMIITNSI